MGGTLGHRPVEAEDFFILDGVMLYAADWARHCEPLPGRWSAACVSSSQTVPKAIRCCAHSRAARAPDSLPG